MMRAIGDQVEKNPEYLSILDKKAIKNGKIDDETQVEQVSVMNKLLNDALRAKGYKGPDIKMVLTDVEDPNGPYYTDTLTNTVVFDRKELAKSNRDQILNALGHEFGHYSKEDDKDKSQDIANHTGKLLEDGTKGMVAKGATEETLAAIRNNKNVITGEEGKKLAESIPMDRREYYKAIIITGSAEKFIVGAEGGLGVIYNKDPVTGEEEYGIVWKAEGAAGIDYDLENIKKEIMPLKLDWEVEGYEKEGKPIKDLEGKIAKIQFSLAAFGIGVGAQIDDKDGVSLGAESSKTSIKLMLKLGYIGVKKLENPNEKVRKAIKFLTNNPEEAAENIEAIKTLKGIINESSSEVEK
ncbi:hemin transporter [Fusobacterium polymorphum]|uniref:hemin transporter n=1 Tax=Fusobacterium nucleatum subsp. polymorphum TaxID=76857 RepID=UPI003CC53915